MTGKKLGRKLGKKSEKGGVKEKLVAVEGACISCPKAMSPGGVAYANKLVSTSDIETCATNESILTENDYAVNVNILPFLACTLTPSGSCRPIPFADFSSPWLKTAKSFGDIEERILTEESYFWCANSGMTKVRISNPGQGDLKVGDDICIEENYIPQYDGTQAAPGLNDNASFPGMIDLTNEPGDRDPDIYNDILNQFSVENHPRYERVPGTPGNSGTKCNFFVWDATRAMGVEIPHYHNINTGESAYNLNDSDVRTGYGNTYHERNANATIDWLENEGAADGWEVVSASEAQAYANQGIPAVATFNNPRGAGHMAMVRPSDVATSDDPIIAQAGSSNYNETTVSQGFGGYADDTVYYVNTTGEEDYES